MKKIVVDAAYCSKDPGVVVNVMNEKDLNIKMSKYMQDYLEENYTGHEVKLTRNTDIFS
ncbi:N-acetylmuramoyl-L-alanine amidase [Peribacillus muralis]|uniref:N-acetylmuramoyl-L-alanine amidase n=1 Tax=Peribacillus muralis TaxID=264697 RepID=UPI003D030B8E